MIPSLVDMTLAAQDSPAAHAAPGRPAVTAEGPSFAAVLKGIELGADRRQTLAAGQMHLETESVETHAGTDQGAGVVADDATVSEAMLPVGLRAFALAQGLDESTVTHVFAPAPGRGNTPAVAAVSEVDVLPTPAPTGLTVEPSLDQATLADGDHQFEIAPVKAERPAMPPMPTTLQGHAHHPETRSTDRVIDTPLPNGRPGPTIGSALQPLTQPLTQPQPGGDGAVRDARAAIQIDAFKVAPTPTPADAAPGATRTVSTATPVTLSASPSLDARTPTDASPGPQPGPGPRVDISAAMIDNGIPTRVEVLSVPLESAETVAREGADPLARREHALQVSTQIAELLAERVIARIRQGHWQVRLMLSPARLGFIDIQLEMRRGALEATFTASQASTREVLADNLWRLRDTLSESGMQVAHMSLAGDRDSRGGSFLTPQRHDFGRKAPSVADLNELVVPSTDIPPQGLLDVRV